MYIELFVLAYLVLISIIDLKHKTIPSPLTTGMIFILVILNTQNIIFGVFAFVFGWFLIEADFFSGLADLKTVTVLGLMISDLNVFFLMVLLLGIYGIFYKVLQKKIVKQKEEIAFLPVFLVVYITLLLVEGIPI